MPLTTSSSSSHYRHSLRVWIQCNALQQIVDLGIVSYLGVAAQQQGDVVLKNNDDSIVLIGQITKRINFNADFDDCITCGGHTSLTNIRINQENEKQTQKLSANTGGEVLRMQFLQISDQIGNAIRIQKFPVCEKQGKLLSDKK